LVSKPRNNVFASGDSTHFILKWCELYGGPISYISPYDLKLLMDHKDNLKNGTFEISNPNQYSRIVNKFNSKTIIFPFNKLREHWNIYIIMNNHNSKLLQTYIEKETDMNIGDQLSEEEFPCVICFDSLPTHKSD